MITAPFNFVPLNDKVFFPPWADDISHDVPFEDAESGVVEIEITAKSPIFVRDSVDETKFCNYNGKYYIPSTSIKGMVRNVLEIMSFSKMRDEVFTDNTYAVRDLSSAKNFYMTQMQKKVHCGWLKKDGGRYLIEDCDTPLRIHHKQIDYAYNIDFASHFRKVGFEKTSEYKYNLIGGSPRTITVSEPYKSETNPKYDKRLFCKYEAKGKKGTLVLTGQPTPRQDSGKMGDGKGFEFVFFESKGDLEVQSKVFENFKSAYFDRRETEPKESSDWKFWKKRLENGEKVPVFFQKEGKEILHFGLSYLYKLPYKNSVKNGIDRIHFNDELDLSQAIFGHIDKSNKKALKGRVQFSHFKAIKNIKELPSRTEILGTPRASYYPMYVKQDGELFTTFMDNHFVIAGRKRYPIHKGNGTKQTEDTGNSNVGTTFRPLQDGVVFRGKMRYHNLKKAELGAILSALTFHNTPNTFHNVGLAKSLGYGKVEIKIDGLKIEEYLKEFEANMTTQIQDWKKSVQLRELLSMAIEQNNSGNSQLKYMSLEDFAKNKTGNNKDYLRNYTKLTNIKTVDIKSLISDADLKEIERKSKEIQEQRKIKKEHNEAWRIAQETRNIQRLENFITKYKDYSKYIEEARGMIEEIKAEEEMKKARELEEEIKEKWENIDKQQDKQQALNNFINKYKNSKYIEEAEKQLKELQNQNSKTKKGIEELSLTNDSKRFKQILEDNKDNLEQNKSFIKDEAIRVFGILKGKKQKNFFKDIQLGRFLGKDFENDVKQSVSGA